MSVNVRWNGRGWSGKVPRSPVARPEVRIGKGIGIEKRPTERYRKSRMAKNGDGIKKGNKNRRGDMKIHKPREKEKGLVSREITMQEWEEYFMKLLEGREEEGKAETEMKKKQTAVEGTEVTVEEVERQIRKVKKR
jgi:hypothetical protein